MRKILSFISVCILVLTSCKDDDINVFDKSADERAAEAITNLRNELTAPEFGWKIKYTPLSNSGSFYVFLKFVDDKKVEVRSDLPAEDGKYASQTTTYRIDNSLGLELIMEQYCFFSYLFDQDSPSYDGAEFEFDYVNKTSDGALVFRSKTDVGVVPTLLLFQPATSGEANATLGTTIAKNLNTLSQDFDKYTSSQSLTYDNKDLVLYFGLRENWRTITFTSASRKSDPLATQVFDFTTGYTLKKDSLILDEPLTGTYLGSSITLRRIKLSTLSDDEINVCANPIPIHVYSGTTNAGDNVTLQTSLTDFGGTTFETNSDFYFTPLGAVLQDGKSAAAQLQADLKGVLEIDVYYNATRNDAPFYAFGFYFENTDGTNSLVIKEYEPVITGNNIVFNFKPDFEILGSQTVDADISKINNYLDGFSEGGQTYIFKYAEGIYEMFNPCSKWNFILLNPDRPIEE